MTASRSLLSARSTPSYLSAKKTPTLPNTFTVQFGGDRYLVGEGALTQRNYLPFANEDKLSAHILKMALYALAGEGKVDLVISHYSADESAEKLTAILEGTHTFTLDGDRHDLDIRPRDCPGRRPRELADCATERD